MTEAGRVPSPESILGQMKPEVRHFLVARLLFSERCQPQVKRQTNGDIEWEGHTQRQC